MPIPGLEVPDERLFDALGAVLPAWLALALAPRWRFTPPLATATCVAGSLLYCAAILGAMQRGFTFGQFFGSFAVVAACLRQPFMVLPAWTRYAVLDLWLARWQVADGLQRGMPQALMALILVATLVAGPAGLLLHLAARCLFKPKRGKAA